MKPKVSVLIPCYNHAEYIAETIQSVLNQSYENFELIISDDCSTDESRKVIDSFTDGRIRKIFLTENVGTVRNLNGLIEAAVGEYLAVLGSDDFWYSEKLRKQVNVLDADMKLAACFTWADVVDESGKRITASDMDVNIFNKCNCTQGEWLNRFYNGGNCLCHSSVLLRKSVHNSLGLYNIAYRQLHDYDMWIRILQKFPIHIINERLVGYRRAVSISNSVSASSLPNTIRFVNENKTIIYNMINDMEKSVFCQGFKDNDASEISDIDFKAEKYLLFKNYTIFNKKYFDLGNVFLFNNITPELLNTLTTKYLISLKDLYSDTAEYSDIYPNDITYSFFTGTKNKEVEQLKNSLSWKITKPIRYIGRIQKTVLRKKNER